MQISVGSFRRELGLFGLVFFLFLTDACGGRAQSAPCKPGTTQPCEHPGCLRLCLSNGTWESECSCGSGGAGGAGGGGGFSGGGFSGGGFGAGGGSAAAGGCTPSGGSSGVGAYGGCGTCQSYTVDGNIPMPPCCTAEGACGTWIDPSAAACLGLNPGCVRAQPSGTPDPSCGSVVGSQEFPGCCRSDTGACGFAIDFDNSGGPDFGCTDFFGYGGGGPQKCLTSDSCAICRQKNCWDQTKACLTFPDCAALLTCLASCTDAPCADNCAASYPSATAPHDALTLCVMQHCATNCPTSG